MNEVFRDICINIYLYFDIFVLLYMSIQSCICNSNTDCIFESKRSIFTFLRELYIQINLSMRKTALHMIAKDDNGGMNRNKLLKGY